MRGGWLWLALLATSALATPPQPPLPPLTDPARFTDVFGPIVATPADIYGPLFNAVQMAHVFADSKSFADAVPRRDPGAILNDYRVRHPRGRAALEDFVLENFAVPAIATTPSGAVATARTPILQHITALWSVLTRTPTSTPADSSALQLPRAYVVPGGRFREIYYWDSYFTMLGLIRDRRDDLVESMIDDFTTLIERYDHIPNGTRTYYLGRSQPPVYYLMLGLSRARDPALFARRLAALRREHEYWMRGSEGLAPGRAAFHVVRLADGSLLNRYWDARATPREESYAEDVATARGARRPVADTYRDLRAAAESGWDFSTRWLIDPHDLGSVRTTAIVPIDLNSLLFGMERMIAIACAREGDIACARDYAGRAGARASAIRRTFWNARGGYFADLDWRTHRQTATLSAATLFPLFTGLATRDQAKAVAATVRRRLLAPGGLRTTTVASGQQWDAPNGWAPLQWVGVEALRRNGEPALARIIATRWIATVGARYARTGKLVEKYDIESQGGGRSLGAAGGEYPLQDGFGWTNGVTRALIADYDTSGD